MPSPEALFQRLSASPFRQRFHLTRAEYDYFLKKGGETISVHAADFIRQRLSPAAPVNDGKQTPMRGHPVFIAQHATATCCRGCLSQWHGIPRHQEMTPAQQSWVVEVITCWLRLEMEKPAPEKKVRKNTAAPEQLNLL
ncbi:DUF4186 domain-containing protein [Erwinia sp. P6884]|uniref:DUF4186 domain-containing protein n=1 Tax=Erwinia sp. P6884 TaxID=3141450 RepID=UPI003188BF9F